MQRQQETQVAKAFQQERNGFCTKYSSRIEFRAWGWPAGLLPSTSKYLKVCESPFPYLYNVMDLTVLLWRLSWVID